ncbi:GNAT family N-acetyltransferase [Dactylosporangium maewongense]|uniref:GNAT family N-acetyltransferase n=1 Tax=Dactylosporangium maewongense TaxID=634393 RepID=A0ABP4L7L3_9ACTN
MLTLRPLTPSEFTSFTAALKAAYALDEVQAGRGSPAEVEARIERQFATWLPDGLATEGHLLYAGVVDGDVVGHLWIGLPTPDRAQAWIYEISVEEAHRRRGHGRALMLAAEEELRARGVTRVGLNVFGHNPGALRLYESLGFETTSRQMSKTLP